MDRKVTEMPYFIVFEGINGCGKTTLMHKLSDRLLAAGRQTAIVYDPGGTELAAEIRKIVKNGDIEASPEEQMLLYTAARSSLRRRVVELLNLGVDVICDRWVMSTEAYQGMMQKVGVVNVQAMHDAWVKLNPDLYLVLDIDAETARMRLELANTKAGDPPPDKERFERQGIEWAEELRGCYKMLAEDNPRAWLVDADQPVDDVFDDVLDACRRKIPGWDTI